MSKKRSVTPHDDFFKLLMQGSENVNEIVRAILPPALIAKLNLDSLRKIDSEFTEGKSKSTGSGNFRADVVYECKLISGKLVSITFLFEHKSYKAKFPHLQLLRYMLGIWEREKKNGQALRPILPILFYHGQRKWEYRSFQKYFEGDNVDEIMRPFIPSFEYIFLNLQEKGDNWINEKIGLDALRIALLLMRYIRSDELPTLLSRIFKGVEKLEKTEEGRQQLEEIWLYLILGSKDIEEKIVEDMDHATYMKSPVPKGSTAWGIIKLLEKKAREEALSEGRSEGEFQAKSKIAFKMLEEGFDISSIVQLTGLDKQTIENLKVER